MCATKKLLIRPYPLHAWHPAIVPAGALWSVRRAYRELSSSHKRCEAARVPLGQDTLVLRASGRGYLVYELLFALTSPRTPVGAAACHYYGNPDGRADSGSRYSSSDTRHDSGHWIVRIAKYDDPQSPFRPTVVWFHLPYT
jgi:hypothetical protein